ncbi:hypothetical protein AB0D49_41605, partial [Streptomyces sp. NPDC048290]|uniref:hypothetical protein n=1 Tax=Streptomyces sp. NPDC048290 TaxID=3155811 RepID=UPI00344AC6E3
MASDELNGLFLALTGSEMPDADPVLMRAHLVAPQRELESQLGELQGLLAELATSVSSMSSGEWGDAYL